MPNGKWEGAEIHSRDGRHIGKLHDGFGESACDAEMGGASKMRNLRQMDFVGQKSDLDGSSWITCEPRGNGTHILSSLWRRSTDWMRFVLEAGREPDRLTVSGRHNRQQAHSVRQSNLRFAAGFKSRLVQNPDFIRSIQLQPVPGRHHSMRPRRQLLEPNANSTCFPRSARIASVMPLEVKFSFRVSPPSPLASLPPTFAPTFSQREHHLPPCSSGTGRHRLATNCSGRLSVVGTSPPVSRTARSGPLRSPARPLRCGSGRAAT